MRIRRNGVGMSRAVVWFCLAALPCSAGAARATPLSSQVRVRLSAGQPNLVVVEFDATATDRAALAERTRRHLSRDDDDILAMRAQGYAARKSGVAGPDAASLGDGTSNSAQCAGSVFASALAYTSNAGIVNVAAAWLMLPHC
jgi:hypothetical protein